jgi:hypothetical protein
MVKCTMQIWKYLKQRIEVESVEISKQVREY